MSARLPRRAPGQMRAAPRQLSTDDFMALVRDNPDVSVLTSGEDDFEDDDCAICQMLREQRGEGRVVSSHGMMTRIHGPDRSS